MSKAGPMKCPVKNCDGKAPGYMQFGSWADAHHAKGISQKLCPKCHRWHFPCEGPHECNPPCSRCGGSGLEMEPAR